MAVTVELRESNDADLSFLLAVFAGTRPLEVEALGGLSAAGAFLAGQWEAKLRAARSAHRHVCEQIIVADGRDAGYVVWGSDADDTVRVVDIAVSEDRRGVGVGSAALQQFLDRADRRAGDGRAVVSLHVEHDNPARRLYERLGFVEVARDERVARMERRSVS